MQRIDGLLEHVVRSGGSDLHLKTDTGKVYMRLYGDLIPLDVPPFTDEEFKQEVERMIEKRFLDKFHRELELDFAYEIPGLARFRGNLYQQRHHMQAAFRVIPYNISTMEELQLPQPCFEWITRPRGLVLVTGPAGSGKSTTLAAMIDKINRHDHGHIVTVEDPVEFVHDDHVALINQRELGHDTLSFANALKFVLRQDPDVILVGEMRDLETIHLAITAAETGHLVFATLHTIDAVQTVDRIIDVFPQSQQQQVRMQLSVNLLGVVSQTLLKRKDVKGRIAAFETLVATSAIRNLIRENKSYQIGSIIQTGAKQGMNTLDQAMVRLVERGLAEPAEARSKAKDPYEFDRLLQLMTEAHKQPGAAHPPSGPAPTMPNAPPPAMPGQAPPQQQAPGQPPAQPPAGGVRGQPNRPGYRRE